MTSTGIDPVDYRVKTYIPHLQKTRHISILLLCSVCKRWSPSPVTIRAPQVYKTCALPDELDGHWSIAQSSDLLAYSNRLLLSMLYGSESKTRTCISPFNRRACYFNTTSEYRSGLVVRTFVTARHACLNGATCVSAQVAWFTQV